MDTVPLASSSNGRLSGKSWKIRNTPTVCDRPSLSSQSLNVVPPGDHSFQKASRQNHGKPECRTPKRLSLLRNYKPNSRRRNVLNFRGIPSPFLSNSHLHLFIHYRRKEITIQRKKAAEERQRLQEAQSKVRPVVFDLSLTLPSPASDGG